MLIVKCEYRWFLMIALYCMLFTGAKAKSIDHYLNYNKLQASLKEVASKSTNLELSKFGQSAGGKELLLFKASSSDHKPAIFVTANMDGLVPVSSMGALYLADLLAKNPTMYSDYTWYIVPCGNPDAYESDIDKVLQPYNASVINNDLDDGIDEDGPDDLNRDGLISLMRVPNPLGNYKVDKKCNRLMVKADANDESKLRYALFAEGIDNDGDGSYNEDDKGGVDISRTFPYGFKYHVPEFGSWSGSETETHSFLRFFSEHPEIAMTITIGKSDFLRDDFVKQKSTAKPKTYSLPSHYASYFGISSKQRYTVAQYVKLMNENRPDMNVDEAYVLSALQLGPLKEPFAADGDDYKAFSDSYKNYMQKDTTQFTLVSADKPLGGTFETWSYYHLGLPSVALRLWDVPLFTSKTKGKNSKTLPREEAFLKYNDSILGGRGFVDWIPVKHPDLAKVEVGGCKKGYFYNPTSQHLSQCIKTQLPWLKQIPNLLPKLSVDSVQVKTLGKNTFRLEVFVENTGKIAAPLTIGSYTQRPAPIILKVEGDITFLQGKRRTKIRQVRPGQLLKTTYLITTKAKKIKFSFDAKNVVTQSSTFKLN